MRSFMRLCFGLGLLADHGCAMEAGPNGGGGANGGPSGTAPGTGSGGGVQMDACNENGAIRTCCETGKQTCGGAAEFLTWGACLDASGAVLSCCLPGEFVGCDGGAPADGGTTTPCASGATPQPGTFGTTSECYGISNTNGVVYALDRGAKTVTAVCTTPAALGPIEAFAISPITGNSYIVAQGTSDFGKFIPKMGSQTCVYTALGTFPSSAIGGFAFSPDGWLYAGEEGSGKIWKLQRDPVTRDPLAKFDLIGTLPNGSEALAVNPLDGLLYNSDGSTLHIVNPSSPGTSLFSCQLGGSGFESIFFDKKGVLYSTNNGTNQFVTITVNRTAGTCAVSTMFSVAPASQLEASDCNIGCAYDECVCE